MKITAISFNCMGLFSFDTLRGFFLSTNIFQRINKIGEQLDKEAADVILLQEVHTYLILTLLKTKLAHYPHVAYKRYLYGPRGGLVVFSKLPIEKYEYINYKKRGSLLNKSFVSHVIQNGILFCKIKNEELTILNTYITPNMDYDYSKNNRFARYIEAQLRQLSTLCKTLAETGTVLTGGDFNTDKKSYLYKTFVEQTKATDVFAKHDSPTKHQEYYPQHQPVTRIDYLFVIAKKKPKIETAKHLFTHKVRLKNERLTYLSDHIGLKATITI